MKIMQFWTNCDWHGDR